MASATLVAEGAIFHATYSLRVVVSRLLFGLIFLYKEYVIQRRKNCYSHCAIFEFYTSLRIYEMQTRLLSVFEKSVCQRVIFTSHKD